MTGLGASVATEKDPHPLITVFPQIISYDSDRSGVSVATEKGPHPLITVFPSGNKLRQ